MSCKSQLALLTLISILCIALNSPAQQPKQATTDQNIYAVALAASLEKMSTEWGQLNLGVGSKTRVPTDYRNMIVQADEITSQLPQNFGIYKVKYLDRTGLIAQYRKVKKEFSILVAHPARVEGERIKVTYTLHWVSYKKPKLFIGVSDWADVYFRHDREKGKYVVDEVVLGGI